MLDDPSPTIRSGAARTLEALGASALEAIGPLRRHQDEPDPDARRAIDTALRAIEQSDHFEAVVVPQDR